MNVDAELDEWREDWQSGPAVHLRLGPGARGRSTGRANLAMSTAAFLDASICPCRGWLAAVMLGAGISAWLGLSWAVMFVVAVVFLWCGWRIRGEIAYFAHVRALLVAEGLPGVRRGWRVRRRRVEGG
jgi:hypothetical protein